MINECRMREQTNGFFYKIKDQENKTKGYLVGIVIGANTNINVPKALSESIFKKMDKCSTLMLKINNVFHSDKLKSPGDFSFDMQHELLTKTKISDKEILELETLDYYCEMGKRTGFEIQKTILKYIRESKLDILNEHISKYVNHSFELDENKMALTARFFVSADFAKECYDDRSAQLAEKINDNLAKAGKYMVAIDVCHIVGENNVRDLLEKKGWRISRIEQDVFVF